VRRTSTASTAIPCLIVVGVTLMLTVAAAWPVIRKPATQLFGHELVGREHDPFTVMEQYAARHVPAPYLQPATDVPGMALTAAIGPVAACNLLTLLTFPLAAAFAFAHARHVIRSTVGAAVAAILFAIAPFHVAHAAYHVHISQVQWLPLFFLALWRLIEQPSATRAAVAAAALTVATAASVYLGFFAAIAGAAAAMAGGLAGDRARRWPAIGWSAAAFGSVALLILAVVLSIAPQLLTATDAFAFVRESVVQHAARPLSYLAPPGHPLLGSAGDVAATPSASRAGLVEQQLALGIAVCTLAVLGLVSAWRDTPIARLRGPIVTAAAVAFLCSLPPVVAFGALELPMPSQALHALAPMFRAYARFGVIVSLMVTTLAGAGVVELLRRPSRSARALLLALLAVAAIEYVPPRPLSRDVLPTEAHRALADVDDARVLDCTAATAGAGAGLRWLMKPEVLIASEALADCLEPAFGEKLTAFGVTHLILRRDADRLGWMASGAAPQGTVRRATFESAALFEVTAPRPTLYVVESRGLYPREFSGADSWRWMGARGAFSVANLSNAPRTAWLDLELEPLKADMAIAVTSADGTQMTWDVTAGRQWYTAGPMTLDPGTQSIALDAGPIASAATLGIGNDPRPLSVRVRGWRIRASG
jgi:hypothetical protein